MVNQIKNLKKYLLLTLEYPPLKGGVANYLWEISQVFDSGQFFVLAPKVDKEITSKAKIYRNNLLYKFFWPKWLKLFRLTKGLVFKEKIDYLITSQAIPVGYVCLLIKKAFNIPYIVILHGHDILACTRNAWKRSLFLNILKNSNKIICNSNYTKGLLGDFDLEIPVKVLHPAPNLRFDDYTFSEQESIEFKNKYNLNNKKIILTVCRLEPRKGIDSVIRSLSSILEKEPEVVYLVVGAGDDRNRLEKLVQEYNLEKKVIFAGSLSDKETALTFYNCDLFVLITRQEGQSVEGFGIVYLEANSFSKPVIGGNSGGVLEAVLDNETGLLVNSLNDQEITDTILKLLSDNDLALKLGQNGRVRIQTDFSKEKRKDKILKIFNE